MLSWRVGFFKHSLNCPTLWKKSDLFYPIYFESEIILYWINVSLCIIFNKLSRFTEPHVVNEMYNNDKLQKYYILIFCTYISLFIVNYWEITHSLRKWNINLSNTFIKSFEINLENNSFLGPCQIWNRIVKNIYLWCIFFAWHANYFYFKLLHFYYK